MRAPISVIVPTLNAARGLPACLLSLMPGVEAGLIREVIITDGGSTDDTTAIAKEFGADVVSGAPSRGGQLRRGCEQAQGDWLLILHADTVLTDNWVSAVGAHMTSEPAAYFRLRFDRGGKAVAVWANFRSRFGLPYGDQGLLISRPLYDRIGGYPDIPLMEDVAIARSLRGELVALDCDAVTSSEKYRAQGWLKRGARNLWTLARYFSGVDPERLAASYRK